MDTWLVVLILGELAFLCFVLWLAVTHWQRRQERRAEERLRVLERFQSAEELSGFLDSEAGHRFLELFARRPRRPLRFLLLGVIVGILALFLSGGFFLLMIRDAWNEGEMFMVWAALLGTGGAGLLVATALSRRLAERWGLFETEDRATLGDD